MKTTTKELKPKLWPQLEKLFGANGACGGCWCQWWRIKKGEKWEKIKGVIAKRRLKSQILNKKTHGVLAFIRKEPIGWCAFDKRTDYHKLNRSPSLKCDDAEWVWSLPCFFVKRGYRNLGVSETMLKEALKIIKNRGGKIAEGYPLKLNKRIPGPFAWTGIYSTFKKFGFKSVSNKTTGKICVRKMI